MKSRKENSTKRRNYSTEAHNELWTSVLREGKWRCDVKMAIFAFCLHEVCLRGKQMLALNGVVVLHQGKKKLAALFSLHINQMKSPRKVILARIGPKRARRLNFTERFVPL